MLKRGIFVLVLLFLGGFVNAQSPLSETPFYSYSGFLSSDFDYDCEVKFEDFLLFAEGFKEFENEEFGENTDKRFDLDKDDSIDVNDFFIFADHYGKECKTASDELIRQILAKAGLYLENKDPEISREMEELQKQLDVLNEAVSISERSPEESSKIFEVIRDKEDKNYKKGELKVLDTTLKHSGEGNKYQTLVWTTPDFPPFKVEISSDEKTYKILDPKFSSSLGSYFLNKPAKLYIAEFDFSEFEKGIYGVGINIPWYEGFQEDFPNSYSWPDLNFLIVDPKDYDLSKDCTLLYESKYPKEDSINLAFIGDVYSEGELPLYAYDVERNLNVFLNDPTIEPYKNRLNIYRANHISSEGLEDLDCRYSNECVPFPFNTITDVSERALCCNSNKVESRIKEACGDREYIMNVINNEERWAGAVFYSSNLPHIKLHGLFRDYILGKKETGITAQNQATRKPSSSTIFSHEIGHLVAGLPDYYRKDPKCEAYKCKMCNAKYTYSDEGLCYDKQGMVKWLNQWCKAEVEIFKNKETFKKHNAFWRKVKFSPYPNPFNPVSKDEAYVKTTVGFNVKYEKGEDPCYALMNVYGVDGQLIDMVVSKNPVSEGNHELKWDGKDFLDQDIVASGKYSYEVSIGEGRDVVEGTVLK